MLRDDAMVLTTFFMMLVKIRDIILLVFVPDC